MGLGGFEEVRRWCFADIQMVNGTTQVRNTSTGVKVTNQAMQVDGLEAARVRRLTADTINTKQQFTIAKTKVDEVALSLECVFGSFVLSLLAFLC